MRCNTSSLRSEKHSSVGPFVFRGGRVAQFFPTRVGPTSVHHGDRDLFAILAIMKLHDATIDELITMLVATEQSVGPGAIEARFLRHELKLRDRRRNTPVEETLRERAQVKGVGRAK